MSPGGTTGTVVEGNSLVPHAPEASVTMKKGVMARPSVRYYF